MRGKERQKNKKLWTKGWEFPSGMKEKKDFNPTMSF
jgi:hypothetical protein